MGLVTTIDGNSVSMVAGGGRPLGTAFSLLKPSWFVTAKHVVVANGASRDDISLSTLSHSNVPARVIFMHPQIDLAVLEASAQGCPRPLYPAHHEIAGANGLVYAGYAPSRGSTTSRNILVGSIPSYEIERRERDGLVEEVVVFDAAESEGGNSGGPILGSNGAVVAAVIENFESGGRLRARGTSIQPIIDRLQIV